MNNIIQIDIPVSSTEQSEILIAELADINFYAFQENQTTLSAYIKEEHFKENILRSNLANSNISYSKIIIMDTSWNKKWEDEFTPIIIDDFVAVRASFHQPVTSVKHEIIITPKMSFGTGHHATTYLMLQQMKEIDFNNTNVLDYGTGTGILAIMAKKSGAKAITAIDNDDWSIINAKENFEYNLSEDVRLIKKDSINDIGTFDIILANINLNVITANIEGLKQASRRSTKLLLSGFLRSDQKTIISIFEKAFFQCETIVQKDDWICIKLLRTY